MTKDRIIENEKILIGAFQNCDLNMLEYLLHDDAVFIYPNGHLFSKIDVLDNYRSGISTFSSITMSQQTINLINDTAIVSLIMELTGKYKDQIIQNKFRYIRVWKLFDEGLKVIATCGVQL